MLIDSDVLVWLTRGHVGAAKRLHAIKVWRISAVTYIELAQGCRDKAELARLKKGLAARGTEIVPITQHPDTLVRRMVVGGNRRAGQAELGGRWP